MSANNNVPSNCDASSFLGALNCGSGVAADSEGQTANTLLAALVVSGASFGAQLLLFALLRLRLSNIYQPRSYLVPPKERVTAPPPGVVAWLYPLFTTPNLAFVQKCGLDAYFFLRYLRMLLKIFVPLAVVILPILLPINNYSGHEEEGLNRLSFSNVANKYKADRTWAHLILALCVILWVCYVIFDELKGYIRVRQAFLTSPQHRIKASATTVLVTAIPHKWLTLEALSGLYDVFPGGIRNIWINRNYDELADKVSTRNSVAMKLEDAETTLVRLCWKKHQEAEEKEREKHGEKRRSKVERHRDEKEEDAEAQVMAQGDGVSDGHQYGHAQGLQGALEDAEEADEKRSSQERRRRKRFGVLGDGFGALGQGLNTVGHGVGHLGQGLAGNLDTGLKKAAGDRLQNNATPAAHIRHVQYAEQGSPDSSEGSDLTPAKENFQKPVHRPTNRSIETTGMSPFQLEIPMEKEKTHPFWMFWKNHDDSLDLPSPQPHYADEEEFPLHAEKGRSHEPAGAETSDGGLLEKLAFWKSEDKDEETTVYPAAFEKEFDEDQDGDAVWRRYIEPKERETMRLPLFSPSWFPSLPLVGKQVDRIYWLRRELARLNVEIEMDQSEPEKYPLMNSAFIQFNHQVAAHMACQSVSHHLPQQMAPRLVEVSPDDVLWTNMSITWWETYARTFVVLVIAAALIILYAIPVTFASFLSKLSTFARLKPFAWIAQIPTAILSAIQGVLGPAVLGFILTLVPIIFGVLVTHQGVPTGTSRELGIQQWYFAFLFIQVFLVVSITGGIVAFITSFASNPTGIVSSLANDLPKASNYFFYYLLVQALSTSASSLLQVGSLIGWFILAPLMDSTARAKWARQTTLQDFTWGSFFPPFTNFAVIGLVYSVIAPLILVFMLIIVGLFWIVFRYNVLYVYQFRNDTGGLLFPKAVNQIFVGVYTMELCLIGLFFIARDANDKAACIPQAVIMIVALIFTIAYQVLMNSAFDPLFRYLPITLEDDAVVRDEEFQRAQAGKFAQNDDRRDSRDVMPGREQRDSEDESNVPQQERERMEQRRRNTRQSSTPIADQMASRRSNILPHGRSKDHLNPSHPSWHSDRWRQSSTASRLSATEMIQLRNINRPRNSGMHDTVGDVLFSGFADELEDLTPAERDLLVRYAFQHSALRAKRPIVWIPRDKLGVGDDEIRRAKKMSTVDVYDDEEAGKTTAKTNIWMSNEGTALDGKGRVVFRRSPPDFSNVDLIAL
ncbi:hypothetical protein BDY17DRAFT_247458 [Neohortaea acidophila]|uniref:DUF221-domain-containing protein n=1 Tax=Neohortaea acidophila TaxID=245834 RepID=A0A6A6Q0Z9_9PEZI|nr:uncharacterized protein BDY17DRAFT_247458 [Neohortaea acidophila]KAF2485701.1 hypothetical protein BDY17DRAFT_247458 [Neohortaea acidophila]